MSYERLKDRLDLSLESKVMAILVDSDLTCESISRALGSTDEDTMAVLRKLERSLAVERDERWSLHSIVSTIHANEFSSKPHNSLDSRRHQC